MLLPLPRLLPCACGAAPAVLVPSVPPPGCAVRSSTGRCFADFLLRPPKRPLLEGLVPGADDFEVSLGEFSPAPPPPSLLLSLIRPHRDLLPSRVRIVVGKPHAKGFSLSSPQQSTQATPTTHPFCPGQWSSVEANGLKMEPKCCYVDVSEFVRGCSCEQERSCWESCLVRSDRSAAGQGRIAIDLQYLRVLARVPVGPVDLPTSAVPPAQTDISSVPSYYS